jgi:exopolysaccharide production protein ExoQ
MDQAVTMPRNEHVAVSTGSGLAWAVGFFFSFRASIVLFFVRVFGTEPRVGAEAGLALGLFLFVLVCFGSIGPAHNSLRSVMRPASVRWVLAFLLLSLCSLAWSATVSLPTSASYWCGLAADVGSVILLLRGGEIEAVSHCLMKGFIWSTCCLAVVAWIMPVQADLRLGDEDYFNTNQIGNLCAFAIFLAQYLMRRKDGKWGLIAAFLAVTLLRSLSKTTIVAFLLAESFLVIQDRSITRKSKIFLTLAVILVILVSWGLFEAYYDIYTNAGNQAETLTGRTAIWAYCLEAAIEHPWIGHGFDSLWKVIPPFGSGQFEARHAENELLQQFYAYGALGIAVLIGIYGSLYAKIRRLRYGPFRVTFVSLLLFIVIRGFAEAEPFDLLLPLWSVVMIAALVDSLEKTGFENANV